MESSPGLRICFEHISANYSNILLWLSIQILERQFIVVYRLFPITMAKLKKSKYLKKLSKHHQQKTLEINMYFLFFDWTKDPLSP